MANDTQPKTPDRAAGARFFPHERLRDYVRATFVGHGVGEAEAAICADALILADLRGVWSHGVVRVPMYCGRLATGAIKARPDIAVTRVATAAALVDGDDGLGFVIARRAMDEAIAIAKAHGVGLAGVRNGGHFGMAALYVAQARDAGCLGFAFTNSSPALAVHGGRKTFLGTSPVAFAAPAPEGKTFLMDMALSVIARGKVRYSAQRGDPIPEGCALDADGRPTTDAAAAMEGVMLPFGGVKGSALAWMSDILGGVFTGAAFAGDVVNPTKDNERPQKVGHVFIAARADLFMPMADFLSRMGELDDRAKAQPRADGFDEILAPGDPEERRRADNEARGIPLTPDVVKNLRHWGDRAGVAWPFD